MKLQMKREALEKMNRQASENAGAGHAGIVHSHCCNSPFRAQSGAKSSGRELGVTLESALE